jgi:hypothetical protein
MFCDGESLKQFIYFQKCIYVFKMHSILDVTEVFFFLADDKGVYGTQAKGKSQAISLFREIPVLSLK